MIIPPGAKGLETECTGFGKGAKWMRLAQFLEAGKASQGKTHSKDK